MELFILIKSILLLALMGYLLWYYSAKDVPLYIKGFVLVSWALTFSPLIILPDDIYYSIMDEDNPSRNQILHGYENWYAFTYWSLFILAWLILPIIQEYVDAGDFSHKEKLVTSLRVNIIFYVVFAGIGIVFIFYLFYIGKLDMQNFSSVLKGSTNCFGILLIMILLGYGFVTIPKMYLRHSNKETLLKYYQFEASCTDQAKLETTAELDELIKMMNLIFRQNDVDKGIKHLCRLVLEKCPSDLLDANQRSFSNTNPSYLTEITGVDHNKIVSLNKQVTKKINELRRLECKWEQILDNAFFLEDVMESSCSIDWKIRSCFMAQRRGFVGNVIDTAVWIWHVKLDAPISTIIGIIFIFFSTLIVLGELTIFSNFGMNLLGSIAKEDYSYWKSQLYCTIPLVYISICCYIGLFNLKIGSLYGLYPHHTDSASLIFAAVNFTRISFALIFNFLQLLQIKKTAFNHSMGEVDLVPVFGKTFNSFFPAVLVILCLVNILDVYDRVLSAFGLNRYKFSEKFTSEKINDGKKLLYKARLIRERNILSSNLTNLREYNSYRSNGGKSSFDYEPGLVIKSSSSMSSQNTGIAYTYTNTYSFE